jgi:hypothetical protein
MDEGAGLCGAWARARAGFGFEWRAWDWEDIDLEDMLEGHAGGGARAIPAYSAIFAMCTSKPIFGSSEASRKTLYPSPLISV